MTWLCVLYWSSTSLLGVEILSWWTNKDYFPLLHSSSPTTRWLNCKYDKWIRELISNVYKRLNIVPLDYRLIHAISNDECYRDYLFICWKMNTELQSKCRLLETAHHIILNFPWFATAQPKRILTSIQQKTPTIHVGSNLSAMVKKKNVPTLLKRAITSIIDAWRGLKNDLDQEGMNKQRILWRKTVLSHSL